MLLQFSVENFRSIKDKAVLSMIASADEQHSNNYSLFGKDKCLKTVAVYGANAAGKSNLFLALTTAIMAVRMSNDRQLGMPIMNIMPFLFDQKTAHAPSSFEFIFIADGKKYVHVPNYRISGRRKYPVYRNCKLDDAEIGGKMAAVG